ncbi:MAG: hypothetical protein ACXVB0_09595 [Mucilaginibacter sp.]
MAECNFTIPFTGPASTLVQKAQAAVLAQGGTFSGNDTNGIFTVPVLGSSIIGSYSISGQNFSMTITHKPFLITCNEIENYVKSHL